MKILEKSYQRILAFGDIHGCYKSLIKLLEIISPQEDDLLIFLGDYVDRGDNSKAVIDKLILLNAQFDCIFIKGNHEEMFLKYLNDPHAHSSWLGFGGQETLESYGSDFDIPKEHRHFMHNGLDYFETKNHIFVHATAHENLHMKDQTSRYLRWTRCHDTRPHLSGKTIICGHTPQFEGLPLDLGHLICIDTAACYGACLTCMDVGNDIFYQANEYHEKRILKREELSS